MLLTAPTQAQEKPVCEEGFVAVGDLGLTQVEGTIQIAKPDDNGDIHIVLRFMSEPVVKEIDPDGPAFGKIEKGDVIVAVNGKLITSEGAGQAFVNPPVGVPVDIRIRRDGREGKVTIVPEWICVDKESAIFPQWVNVYKRIIMGVAHKARDANEQNVRERVLEAVRDSVRKSHPDEPGAEPPPRPSKAPRPDAAAAVRPPRPDRPEPPVPGGPGFPHPWMGIGLKCNVSGNWYSKDLKFIDPPEVFRVEPASEAERAGLERRDLITHIDGIPMDTLEGTERFVEVRPGQRIEWTVLRDGEPRTLSMEAEPIPEYEERFEEARRIERIQPLIDALRYNGKLGDTAIEVRGSAPVNVSVDYVLGLVTIKTPDTTIRLKNTTQEVDIESIRAREKARD
jgi:hypothetical protein